VQDVGNGWEGYQPEDAWTWTIVPPQIIEAVIKEHTRAVDTVMVTDIILAFKLQGSGTEAGIGLRCDHPKASSV
jgi:hypothetical protein